MLNLRLLCLIPTMFQTFIIPNNRQTFYYKISFLITVIMNPNICSLEKIKHIE